MDPLIKIERNNDILYIHWINSELFDLDHDSLCRLRDDDFGSWALVGIQFMGQQMVLKIWMKSWHSYGTKRHINHYVDDVLEKLHLYSWENVDQSGRS